MATRATIRGALVLSLVLIQAGIAPPAQANRWQERLKSFGQRVGGFLNRQQEQRNRGRQISAQLGEARRNAGHVSEARELLNAAGAPRKGLRGLGDRLNIVRTKARISLADLGQKLQRAVVPFYRADHRQQVANRQTAAGEHSDFFVPHKRTLGNLEEMKRQLDRDIGVYSRSLRNKGREIVAGARTGNPKALTKDDLAAKKKINAWRQQRRAVTQAIQAKKTGGEFDGAQQAWDAAFAFEP